MQGNPSLHPNAYCMLHSSKQSVQLGLTKGDEGGVAPDYVG